MIYAVKVFVVVVAKLCCYYDYCVAVVNRDIESLWFYRNMCDLRVCACACACACVCVCVCVCMF